MMMRPTALPSAAMSKKTRGKPILSAKFLTKLQLKLLARRFVGYPVKDWEHRAIFRIQFIVGVTSCRVRISSDEEKLVSIAVGYQMINKVSTKIKDWSWMLPVCRADWRSCKIEVVLCHQCARDCQISRDLVIDLIGKPRWVSLNKILKQKFMINPIWQKLSKIHRGSHWDLIANLLQIIGKFQ